MENLKKGVRSADNQPRALYDYLVDEKYADHPNANKIIITESYLLLMQNLQDTSVQKVTFNVINNVGTQLANEVRLNQGDRFCVRDWGFFLQKAGASAVPTAVTPAQIAVAKLYTYPNPTVFATGAEAANLEAIYNGYVSVQLDSIQYYQKFPMRNFCRIPTSQQGVSTTVLAGPTYTTIPRDGFDSMNYGFSPVYPAFELSGDGQNDIDVTLTAATAVAGTSSSNYLTAIFRGFLIQNVNKSK